jgi:hypothetical protein
LAVRVRKITSGQIGDYFGCACGEEIDRPHASANVTGLAAIVDVSAFSIARQRPLRLADGFDQNGHRVTNAFEPSSIQDGRVAKLREAGTQSQQMACGLPLSTVETYSGTRGNRVCVSYQL